MSQNVVNVSYTNNKGIEINNQHIPTRDFYALELDQPSKCPYLNSNDDNFMEEQKHLIALDCMKDGNKGFNIANQVYDILYAGKKTPYPFDKLSRLEYKFSQCFANKMSKHSWIKLSKESPLGTLFPQKVVFNDSGLSAEYFIKDPLFCGNFANEVIDPAKRSPIRSEKDIVFPENNQKIVLNECFLKFFGFEGCSLEATRTSQDGKYDYLIAIPGNEKSLEKSITIRSETSNLTIQNKTWNVHWFQGNKEKNQFILQSNPPTEIKKGLLLTKELGDVLQVLLMFVWNIFNQNVRPYCMVTHDKVVLLRCMLLNLNCVLTSAEKDEKKRTKLRHIEYFEPDLDSVEKAKERFRMEQQKIIDHNNNFIQAINTLRKHPHIPITKSGVEDSVTFPKAFYQILFSDLQAINAQLIRLNVNDLSDIVKINEKLQEMKKEYLLNLFIRKVQNQFKMTLAKKYTKKSDFCSKLENYGYGKKSFYEMGRQFAAAKHSRKGFTTKRSTKGGQPMIPNTEIEYSAFDALEFDDSPVEFYDDDEETTFDLLKEFEENLKEQMEVVQYDFEKDIMLYWDDFRSEIYSWFYIYNQVFYDNDLYELISYILVNEFSIPSESNPTATVRSVSKKSRKTQKVVKSSRPGLRKPSLRFSRSYRTLGENSAMKRKKLESTPHSQSHSQFQTHFENIIKMKNSYILNNDRSQSFVL